MGSEREREREREGTQIEREGEAGWESEERMGERRRDRVEAAAAACSLPNQDCGCVPASQNLGSTSSPRLSYLHAHSSASIPLLTSPPLNLNQLLITVNVHVGLNPY